MSGMYQVVYVSSAASDPSRQELAAMLDHARTKNERLGITGMLLYRDGDYMQALEGEEEAVRELYETICRDPRHTSVTPIVEHGIEARSFADWRMGFRELLDEDLRSHPGFSDFLRHGFVESGQARPGIALRLLATFASA